MRSISGFNGSSINGSFAAGDPISASKLNQLATGIDITRTMMSNDIQFMGNTGGTAYSLGQQVYETAQGLLPQFWCVVTAEVNPADPTGDPLYFLKTTRGLVSFSQSNFPHTQQDYSNTPNNEYTFGPSVTTSEQRMIFDMAAYPIGARTAGPPEQDTSQWMARNGKFKLDTTDLSYYVTVSLLEYNDKKDWYTGEAFIKYQPWVTLLRKTGDTHNSIFKPCYNQTVRDNIYFYQDPDTGVISTGSAGVFPIGIGYQMKVIARIDWDTESKTWSVTQEMVGPIELSSCIVAMNSYDTQAAPPSPIYSDYMTAQADKFYGIMFNKDYVATYFQVSAFTDSDILDREWWYDPKTI